MASCMQVLTRAPSPSHRYATLTGVAPPAEPLAAVSGASDVAIMSSWANPFAPFAPTNETASRVLSLHHWHASPGVPPEAAGNATANATGTAGAGRRLQTLPP